jgi:oligogalacturonide lyase
VKPRLSVLTAWLVAATGLSLLVPLPHVSYAQNSTPLPEVQAVGPPKTWIDKDTGHRVIRLTDDRGSTGLYFNVQAYTPDGFDMVYKSRAGIGLVNVASSMSKLVVRGAVRGVVVGTKTRRVFFMKPENPILYAANLDTGEIRSVATLPPRASIATINADETLAAGTYIDGDQDDFSEIKVDSSLRETAVKAEKMELRLNAHIPMVLFTVDLRSGTANPLLHSTDWINHPQFSPTDPSLLMYCHEGSWEKVDRIWTIRTDGSENRLVHKRSMTGEIAGHEFWANDGKTIWYDLQRPRAQVFYLASYNVSTQARQWFHLDRDQWSIHFNISADGNLFCGDGADYSQVAKSHNGEWIELFHPEPISVVEKEGAPGAIHLSGFRSEHLVNMAKQTWKLEPNVRFSPDQKYVVFTANMFGDSYVFAVEIEHPK